ncbi:DUF4189 domain-containing protein [Thermodesulfobacteriota bacterium]
MIRLIILLVFFSLALGVTDVSAGWFVVFYSKECRKTGTGKSKSLETAMALAERACRKNGCKDCKYWHRTRKRCFALARNRSGKVTGVGSNSLEYAERRALRRCESRWDDECRIFARHCQKAKKSRDRHENLRKERERQREVMLERRRQRDKMLEKKRQREQMMRERQ